jgi:hypothetical protein
MKSFSQFCPIVQLEFSRKKLLYLPVLHIKYDAPGSGIAGSSGHQKATSLKVSTEKAQITKQTKMLWVLMHSKVPLKYVNIENINISGPTRSELETFLDTFHKM